MRTKAHTQPPHAPAAAGGVRSSVAPRRTWSDVLLAPLAALGSALAGLLLLILLPLCGVAFLAQALATAAQRLVRRLSTHPHRAGRHHA